MNWFKAQNDQDRSGDVLVSFDARWLEVFKTKPIKVVFRRRTPSSFRAKRIFVYISSPAKILLGYAEIEEVKNVNLGEAISLSDMACISEEEINKYFFGYQKIGAYVIENFKEFPTPIGLYELNSKTGFNPPQSFVALSHRASNLLDKRIGKSDAEAH